MSEIRANTVSNAAGTGPATLTGQSAAKAWASVENGGVASESQNVSSVTDNGAGNYTVSWTSNFSNDNYAPCGMSSFVGGTTNYVTAAFDAISVSSITLRIGTPPSTGLDPTLHVGISLFGDLA